MLKKLRVDIDNQQKAVKISTGVRMLVRRCCHAVLELEKVDGNVQVDVTFVDNDRIHQVNVEQRGIDAPTDVLSFPLLDCNDISFCAVNESLGDIVISLERAKEQADRYGHSFEREIAFLTVHSMLHLLGYDHVNSEEEELEMRKKQSEILSLMGLEIKQ